jgi:hypothetical protein
MRTEDWGGCGATASEERERRDDAEQPSAAPAMLAPR